MRATLICLLLTCGLLDAPRAWSASAAALDDFAQGSAAYDAADYSRARALFERALDEGMTGPAIHYNIGSAAYRGGDLPRAERAFREVARTPSMASLAYYNRGLVALERRDETDAREWFQRTLHDATPDARLQMLASRRLEELPESRSPGAWYYYSRAGVGYDDNVALRSASFDSAATGQADAYGELILATTYSIGQWRVDTGASLLEYQDLHDFSQSNYYFGGARGFRTDQWYFELGATGSQASLGGDVYERDVAAGGQATRLFAGGSRLRAQLRATSVQGQGLFTGLTGRRVESGLYFDQHWRGWSVGAHARAETDDSDDPVFTSRWFQLGADTGYEISPVWNLALSAALRRTRHAAQPDTVGSWDDKRATLLVGLSRTLWKRTQLFVRYERERNDSPVAGYDYERSWAAVSLENWR
jgi:tetratricopeptide (TPR) repeat protein